MAGDWIKMRTSLLTNPKVNGIARVLEASRDVSRALSTGYSGDMSEIVTRNVMRHVTVSSLLIVWGAANEHTDDGVFKSADLSDIDDMVGIPGFGEAMESVGWASYDADSNTVTLPNFSEYNTSGASRSAGAKSAAQRQKEYRDRKKQSDGDVTRDVTRDRREEKSREEIGPKGPSSPDEPPTAAAAVAGLPCPYDRIVELYHERLPDLPRVKLMPKTRQRALRKLWGWVLSSKKSDGSRRATSADEAMAWLAGYFARAAENDFLMGRTPRSGEHANWRCDLDFLLTDKGMRHVIEKTQEAA